MIKTVNFHKRTNLCQKCNIPFTQHVCLVFIKYLGQVTHVSPIVGYVVEYF